MIIIGFRSEPYYFLITVSHLPLADITSVYCHMVSVQIAFPGCKSQLWNAAVSWRCQIKRPTDEKVYRRMIIWVRWHLKLAFDDVGPNTTERSKRAVCFCAIRGCSPRNSSFKMICLSIFDSLCLVCSFCLCRCIIVYFCKCRIV